MSRSTMGMLATGALLAAASAGCSPATTLYHPRVVAQHELVLRFDDGMELSAGGRPVARSYRYDGLADFVGCVPEARHHALEAQADGRLVGPLSVTGGVLAGVGLGGIGGLAFLNKDNTAMAAIFAAGIGTELVALTLVLIGRANKVTANGHAVDAMNYYNDAVGSSGRSCGR